MKKFLTGSMVLLGFVALPVALSPKQSPPVRDYKNDPRLSALRNFFHRAASPAEHLAAVFLEAADIHALDWRLLPSLSFVETGGGKAARNNNFFGWDSGRARFSSPSAGIHAVAYGLSHGSAYRGKKLDSLLATYNPKGPYAKIVKSVMSRIAAKE